MNCPQCGTINPESAERCDCGFRFTSVDDDSKTCPFCAEKIKAAAVKCRYCGEMLDRAEAPALKPLFEGLSKSESKPTPQGTSVVGIIGLILCAFALFMPYFAAVFLVPIGIACAVIAVKRGHDFIGYSGLLVGLLGLYSIYTTSEKITRIVKDPFSADASLESSIPPIVTLSEYNAIVEGMSYGDVARAIGDTGEELSRSEIMGTTTVMYQWKNSNGSNMNAMFQDGRLVSRAQFGLR
jgi:hypothetical protein